MNMKNIRFFAAIGLVALIIGVAVRWQHFRYASTTRNVEVNATSEAVGVKPTSESPLQTAVTRQGSNATAFAQASDEQQRRLAEMGITPGMTKAQMQEKIAQWYRGQRDRLADKWRNPISFYGAVVDQNTNPVPQAAVTFIWNDSSDSGTSKSNVTTDANGLFSLTGVTGRGLSVYIEKPGYYEAKRLNQINFDYAEGFVSDPGNIVVFHLRRKGPGADLITSQYGVRPVLQFNSSHDGSPVRVDFFSRRTGVDGQMDVSQKKPAYGAWQKATGWSYRLAIPNGGFVETIDEFPFQAPESGYQPVVEFNFQKGDTNWTERIDKTFYIAFGNPRRYGRIRVETSMTTGTILEYAINPDGSRYLESK